jgi:hypothetical protein
MVTVSEKESLSACTSKSRHERYAIPVKQQRARAAHTMLTPQPSCGQSKVFAEKVRQKFAHLNCAFHVLAIDAETNCPAIAEMIQNFSRVTGHLALRAFGLAGPRNIAL